MAVISSLAPWRDPPSLNCSTMKLRRNMSNKTGAAARVAKVTAPSAARSQALHHEQINPGSPGLHLFLL